MKIVDLTHTISPSLPHAPYDEAITLETIKTVEKDGYHNSRLTMTMHLGTHLDGKKHFIKTDETIADLPLNQLILPCHIIDVRDQKNIDTKHLEHVKKGDAVLFLTGWSQHYTHPRYYQDFPVLSDKLVHKLIDKEVSLVGLDTPSPDYFPFNNHVNLFTNNILILENLTNLENIVCEQNWQLFVIPLKITTEASPVRAFVIKNP